MCVAAEIGGGDEHLQELGEEDFLRQGNQLPDLLGRAVAQLDAVDPFGHENAARAVLLQVSSQNAKDLLH